MFDNGNADATARSYVLSNWLFLRAVGLIYGIAFLSLAAQIKGLAGSKGILPFADFAREMKQSWGAQRFWLFPTVCWWNQRDGFLQALCLAGALLSGLLMIGFVPALLLFLLWSIYLSLVVVGRIFLNYQWDVLLLETGFLAIFLAPLEWLPVWPPAASASPIVRWLFGWLLFRLMFSSGWVKLRRGDPTWRKGTTLTFHYETQPLPAPLSWYAHRLPACFQKLSVILMFALELGMPLLYFGPGTLPHLAAVATIALMLLIMATGNYCFFNLNTIALALLLFDDNVILKMLHGLSLDWPGPIVQKVSMSWPLWVVGPVAVLLLFLSLQPLARLVDGGMIWPAALEKVFDWLAPFRLVNGYGLFSIMTTSRPEIIVEGSNDGMIWKPYEFKWKPGEVTRCPRFVQPRQPRLDWQMWFAANGRFAQHPWFMAFLMRLLEGSRDVLKLLRTNPFLGTPPRFIRAMLYDYRFTDFKTRRATGAWWRRERLWLYGPVLSLRGEEKALMPPKDFPP